jgi:hypothetical protein
MSKKEQWAASRATDGSRLASLQGPHVRTHGGLVAVLAHDGSVYPKCLSVCAVQTGME